MTLLEVLAMLGFGFTLVGKMGLWYKKTWGWALSSLGAAAWLAWGVMIAFTQPGSGGWILLGNDITFLVVSIIGWFIWKKEEKGS